MSASESDSSNTNPLLSSSSSEVESELEASLREWQATVDELKQKVQQGESSRMRRRRTHIERGRELGHAQIRRDYFSEIATYPNNLFRRRFRMKKEVFMRIVDRLEHGMEYFQQRSDATGRLGISALQKCTSAIRMLAYGTAADACDEYLRISEGTARQCLSHFCDGIINFFGEEYLRRPTATDIQRLLQQGEERGFPGMLGSIDCMHWGWKNCPAAWKGMFARGDHKKPTIILEAVVSKDLWFWHAFFGVPGTCNDLNVLDRSLVFDDILQGTAPSVTFTVNGHTYNEGYYLTDGIYPSWPTFVQSIKLPQGPKAKLFAQKQEGCRKDVERGFGVLQSRFAIVRNPALSWDPQKVGKIMKTYIILHNIIVENERGTYEGASRLGNGIPRFDEGDNEVDENEADDFSRRTDRPPSMRNFIQSRIELRDPVTHRQLKADLKEHIWQVFGEED